MPDVLGGRERPALVGDADAAAEVEVLDGDAGRGQVAGERDDGLGGAGQRLERGDLRADVDVDADGRERRPRLHLAEQRRRRLDRHAELVRLEAGRDVRMAPGVDVGVDAQGDPGDDAAVGGEPGQPVQLPGRLDVDGQQAERDGAVEFVEALADAGEDDLGGREPAAQGDLDLPHRVGVGGAAEAAHEARDGKRRIGLERVMDGVRRVAEGVVERPVGPTDDIGVVDVGGRAGGGGNRFEQGGIGGGGGRRGSVSGHRLRDHNAKGRPGRRGESWYPDPARRAAGRHRASCQIPRPPPPTRSTR